MAATLIAHDNVSSTTTVRQIGGSGSQNPDYAGSYSFQGSVADIMAMATTLEDGTVPQVLYTLGLPSGDTVLSSSWHSDSDGLATLTVNTKRWVSSLNEQVYASTIRISLVETTYELKDHPKITEDADVLKEVLMWLATDEKLRLPDSNGKYHYYDAEGDEQEVTETAAISFCNSYLAGITSYVRYYPVIEKTSTYRYPPGLDNVSNRPDKITGGTFSDFSEEIGTFDTPPVTLNGYASTNWFKSGDEWVQRGDKLWDRTERWTYTPSGSTSNHAWIYDDD